VNVFLGDVVVAKDERTRVFLESLERQPEEKPMRLVYYKMRDGRMVEQIWRLQ